ncbi:helix-turn-helix domain-containing protein [Streptomyces sp. CB01881]|uniref:helix-turn-helix domain-containing protein n=1 Tax=Streptomyces sp. CB01881 TaxID=2078691 RepID=UPI0019D63F4D|nr:helix-turn-helix domain-containing protein [Streptomyces sp. CB01881]
MEDLSPERAAALTRLRRLLRAGLAESGLTMARLVQRTGLSRTTVSQALSESAPPPSPRTVAALAETLGLDPRALLELRDPVRRPGGRPGDGGPGLPIGDWDPHDLEVHPAVHPPAGAADGRPDGRRLPGYVRRPHDEALAGHVAAVAAGGSRMAVLIGSSSTGKTRSCWEAVQPLAELDWRLWHPFDPTRAEAALADLGRVGPRTVVWLNEAQHYLGAADGVGERIAAALHALLTDPQRGPVLVLGTLWPNHSDDYARPPAPGGGHDPYSRVRELLAGRRIILPTGFDDAAAAAARALAAAGDTQLELALASARDGRLTQFLAGAPELVDRYESASPGSRALLDAAMDATRLGVGPHLPHDFLRRAAVGYPADEEYDALPESWIEDALADTGRTVHGGYAPLRQVRARPAFRAEGTTGEVPATPVHRLADYLEEHGRRVRRPYCPPESFWSAAYRYLDQPDDLDRLARAASDRMRDQWAHRLWEKAAEAGSSDALVALVRRASSAGDAAGAERLACRAAAAGNTGGLAALAWVPEHLGDFDEAERLSLLAAGYGLTFALQRLQKRRAQAGDLDGAARNLRQAADAGDLSALLDLAAMAEAAGDRAAAEELVASAAEAGRTEAVVQLAALRELDGAHDEAWELAHRASAQGDDSVMGMLATLRERSGDLDGAETYLRRAAEAGEPDALAHLAWIREGRGARDEAEELLREAVTGDLTAVASVAVLRAMTGDLDGARRLADEIAGLGECSGLVRLAGRLKENGDPAGAERDLRRAAAHGDVTALDLLAAAYEEAGDLDGAEEQAVRAARAGGTSALVRLCVRRGSAGETDAAARLALLAADAGNSTGLLGLAVVQEQRGDHDGAEKTLRLALDRGVLAAHVPLAQLRLSAGDAAGARRHLLRAADSGEAFLEVATVRAGFGADAGRGPLWPHGLDPDGTPTAPW